MPLDLKQYTAIHYDSRKVIPGSIFIAIEGEKFDGHNFINDAINKGATLIITEKDLTIKDIKILKVKDARLTLAELSAQFYGTPSEKLSIIGVTGTNGKTTVTHLIQGLLEKCALLGTIGFKASPQATYKELGNTTPQSKETQEILADIVKDGYKYLTMEVSSHALEQKRVAAITYKTMIVTNLTQDHLDYHITMDNYFIAKAKAFLQTSHYAILNVDDPYYDAFRKEAEKQNLTIITYGVTNQADLQATDLEFNNQGLSYNLIYKNKSYPVRLRLNGLFNVYNSLAAVSAVLQEGIRLENILAQMPKLEPVAGRFETIQQNNSPLCIVDYAHSPDGLYNVLIGARELLKHSTQGRLICLFGCGGDRDITKRPKMGKIAYELSDLVYITSDNPRSEDPEQIIADILAGIPNMSKVKINANRASAIEMAIKDAGRNDIVVIAGKGHEDYQILKDKTIHFDDKEEVKKVIVKL